MKKLDILPKTFTTNKDIYTLFLNLDILRIIDEGGVVKVLYEDKKNEIIGLCAGEILEGTLSIPYLFAPNILLKTKLLLEVIKELKDGKKGIIVKVPYNDEKLVQILLNENFKLINAYILFLGDKENIGALKIAKKTETEVIKIENENSSPFIFCYLLKEKTCIGVLNAQKISKEFPIVKINTLYIDEKHRNQKMGTFLLSSFLLYLFKEKNYYVLSEVPMGNLAAIRLFSRFNFGIIGSYKVLFKNGE